MLLNLFNISLGCSKAEVRRERIENNFYNSDEVLNKVAEKILKEIQV